LHRREVRPVDAFNAEVDAQNASFAERSLHCRLVCDQAVRRSGLVDSGELEGRRIVSGWAGGWFLRSGSSGAAQAGRVPRRPCPAGFGSARARGRRDSPQPGLPVDRRMYADTTRVGAHPREPRMSLATKGGISKVQLASRVNTQSTEGTEMPPRLAAWVLAIALAVIVASFGISLIRLKESSDVADVIVAVVAAIATVVVAFFGIHVADAARRDAEAARARSERLHLFEQRRVRRLAATTDADQRAAILKEDPPEAIAQS